MRAGYKEERDALHEEADMPLEQLMALYGYVVPGAGLMFDGYIPDI